MKSGKLKQNVSARPAGKETPNKPTVPREAMKNKSYPIKTQAPQAPIPKEAWIWRIKSWHFMEPSIFAKWRKEGETGDTSPASKQLELPF